MDHLSKKIIIYLVKKLKKSKATIRKNISLLAHEYPNATPNARAQIYAKTYGATVWGKLKEVDRKSLPNMEVQKEKITISQKKSANARKKIIQLLAYETTDPFRKGHIDEINRAYTYNCYTSVFILCRKIIENMLIDILRKNFPDSTRENRELYYDTNQNRYKDFQIILKNFRNKSNEFGLEKQLVERIASLAESLKDKANDKTHSWYHLVRKPKEIDDLDIQNIIHLIKRLESRVGL